MKKTLRYIGLFVLGLFLIIVATLGLTTIVHKVSLGREATQIEDYGQKLSIFDGEINVIDEGIGGKTILLLPGQGTPSPYLDFKPLVTELKKKNRVIVVEPFGYGLSSQTSRPRTIKHYIEELHEITKQLNLDNYVLMGHSIAGLYAVNYAQIYPEEMQGFIGIDSSTPEQPWPGIDMSVFNFFKAAGVFRALMKVDMEGALGIEKTNPDFEQTRLLTMKNLSSRNMSEELSELDNSFPNSGGLVYPKKTPVLLFVAKNPDPRKQIQGWLELHEQQIEGLEHGSVIELEGPHYLHRTQLSVIAEETQNLFDSME